MVPAFDTNQYLICIKQYFVYGEPLFEGTADELLGVAVYGTSVDKVINDMHYAIYRLYALALRCARPILPTVVSQILTPYIDPILDANRYRIEIRKKMVLEKPLYTGRIIDLPNMVVYGTSAEAVRDDVHYEIGRSSAKTGQHRKSLLEPK